MSTKAEIREQVLNDLFRTDLTSEVELAIDYAIRRLSSQPWWFLEKRDTIATVSGGEYLDVTASLSTIKDITITDGSWVHDLLPISLEEFNERYISGSEYKGLPHYFTLYGSQLRLLPIPDASYTVTLYYSMIPPTISAGASNEWTTNYPDLVRREAGVDVAASVLRNKELTMLLAGMRENAMSMAKSENTRRMASGRTKKRY